MCYTDVHGIIVYTFGIMYFNKIFDILDMFDLLFDIYIVIVV